MQADNVVPCQPACIFKGLLSLFILSHFLGASTAFFVRLLRLFVRCVSYNDYIAAFALQIYSTNQLKMTGGTPGVRSVKITLIDF